MLTVEQIWKSVLPSGTSLVAGEEGLSREVSWTVMLKPTPPAFDNLRGGELALISLNSARVLDERLSLTRLIESLATMKAAAVAVAGNIPAEAKAAAVRLGMPLLALPGVLSLRGIEQAVIRAIIEQRTAAYQQEHEISRQLTEIAIRGDGISGIVKKLSEITRKAAIALDESFEPQVSAAPEDFSISIDEIRHLLGEVAPAITSWLAGTMLEASDPPTARFELTLPDFACLAAPVVIGSGLNRYLFLLGPQNQLNEADRLALARASAACAIVAAREQAVVETEDRIQADFLSDLLSGNFQTEKEIINRARRFGCDLTSPQIVFVLRVEKLTPDNRSPQVVKEQTLSLNKSTVELLRREFVSSEPGMFCQIIGDTTVVLLPVSQGNTAPINFKERAQKSQQKITPALSGTVVSIGIGRFYPGLEELKISYREAEQALTMGVQFFGKGSITYFGDLGVYRLLLSINLDELKAFYQECIGRLLEYDQNHGGELIRTLQARLEYSTLAETAQTLHIHRNTLLYRLQRIQEIADLNLEDGETRLRLHLALKAGDIIRAS